MLFAFSEYHAYERNLTHLSLEHGLPQSAVYDIYEDSRGFIWVATAGGGVCFYDGQEFMTFDETKGLAGNIVTSIVEDENGRIFTSSTWGGVTIIDKFNLKVVPLRDKQIYQDLVKDPYGVIWGVGNMISYFDGDQFVAISGKNKLNNIYKPQSFILDDMLYVSHNYELIEIDVLTKKIVKRYSFDNLICGIERTMHNEILVITEDNLLSTFDNGELNTSQIPIPSKGTISGIKESPSGDLWITASDQVLVFNRSREDWTTSVEKINVPDAISICFDQQENVWIGTDGRGITKVVNTPFLYYDNIKGLNDSDNFPIVEMDNGELFVGNSSKGLIHFKNGLSNFITSEDGLAGNKVRALLDNDGVLTIGTDKGVCYYQRGEIQIDPDFDGLYIKSLAKDNAGNLFIGTLGQGLLMKGANGSITEVQTGDTKYIYSLKWDKDVGLCIGTNLGLFIYQYGKVKHCTKNIPNSYIGSVTVDKNGMVWVATDQGVGRWNGEMFDSYTIKEGLSSDVIYLIHADKKGFVWVGTNKGLNRLSINSESDVTRIKFFGFHEGFKGQECNGNGVYENKYGEIYFSTIGGIHKYIPANDFHNNYKTPIYLSNVRVFLEEFDFDAEGESNFFNIPSKIKLGADQNHITFDFFALDYLKGKDVEYSYFLEGFDKNWSPPTKSRYAVYSNLNPGYYTFKVKEANNEFSDIAEIKIEIERAPPPFFRSSWFLLILFLVIGTIVYYFTFYRTNLLIRQSKLLEERVEERTVQIQERENEKTVLLQEVHHRVKNNLQIIISLFRLQTHFTNNEEARELFLNSQNRIRSMSKIHEKLYQTTDLSKVKLNIYLEELITEIVRSYDTQNRINLELDIQECKISIDELTPLALIVNEIITNSVKYGLKDVVEPKIKFSLVQSAIGRTVIIMADNGPGFDIQKWNDPESMGIELVKTLTEQLDGDIKLEFVKGNPFYTLSFKSKS